MSAPNIRALIVDDEAELRRSLAALLPNCLPDCKFEIEEAEDGQVAVAKLHSRDFDFVLMDVRMPNLDGLEALRIIRERNPTTLVVLMTAHGNVRDAIEAIRDGAYDYLEKPVQLDQLSSLLRKAQEAREMLASMAIENPIFDDDIDSELVGGSQKMRKVFDLVHRLSRVDTTVLIRGENGTGKELVARAIHYNSPRKDYPFVALNCGAIPEGLLESELFGHEKGAFTGAQERRIGKFQQATQGTIFLDEIAELKPDMQVKLLRVLQERQFTPVGGNREVKTSARVIAATNRNLEAMMEQGLFREDLFYRLNVMPIFLPPLRDRLDDLPTLVDFFIKKFSKIHPRSLQGIRPEALALLRSYSWPGNIRELENVIERAFIVENSTWIQTSSLPETLVQSAAPNPEESKNPNWDFEFFKEQTERDFIVSALKANLGRINQTVARANIPKNTLLRKIRKYNIDVRSLVPDDNRT